MLPEQPVFNHAEMVMRSIGTALLAGVAAVALAGFAGPASAQSRQIHVLTVPLPGGGIEQIRYSGDVAPQVTVTPGPAALADVVALPTMFGPGSPFATMERVSAEMDREAAAMLRQAAAFSAQPWPAPGQLSAAALREMPPGSSSYSFVSTMSGGNFCTESVAITTPANGGRPHVVRRSSGNCGPQTGAAGGPVALPTAPLPAHGPRLRWARSARPQPYAGLVREADLQR
jgi:hypothetical protein